MKVAYLTPDLETSGWPYAINENDHLLTSLDPNAQFSFYPSSQTTMSALVSGAVQVAVVPPTNVFSSYAAGANNITIVAPDLIGLTYQVFVSTLSPYKTMANLVGNWSKVTWYNTGAGGTGAIIADLVGAQYNLVPNFVTVSSFTTGVENVIAGTITAGCLSVTALQTYNGLYRTLENASAPSYLTGAVIATTNSFVAAHPDAVLAAIEANEESYAIGNANVGNSTVNLLLNEFPTLSVDGARVAVETILTSNVGNITEMQATINADFKYGGLSENLTATSLITQIPNYPSIISWTH